MKRYQLQFFFVWTLVEQSWAFQSQVPFRYNHAGESKSGYSPRYLGKIQKSVLQAKRSPTGDFELQELKAQVESIRRQGVASKALPPTKRFELETYAKGVIENKASPVPLEQVGTRLAGTKWRLVFSTENAALSSLPSDATVVLDFLDDTNMNYSLIFGEKTAGLNKIVAKSTWTAGQGNNFDSGRNPGLVSMVYDKITCDAFGLSNIGIGFFGLLKGRASYIQTVYFDNEIWIDGGYAPDGSTYFSIYTREKTL